MASSRNILFGTDKDSDPSLAKEHKRLFRAFLYLLFVFTTGFLAISVAFYSARRSELEQHVRQLVAGATQSSQANLAMEMFINQTAAYEMRLSTIRERLAAIVTNPSLCLYDAEGVLVQVSPVGSFCQSSASNSDASYAQPIVEAGKTVGRLTISYQQPFTIAGFLQNNAWHVAIIAGAFLSTLWILIAFFRQYIYRVFQRVITYERQASMGLAAQMVAHDALKPLNIQQHGLNLIDRTDDPQVIKRIVRRTLPAVAKAKKEIENLLADLREVGSRKEPEVGHCDPLLLIQEALQDLPTLHEWLDLTVDYQFNHSRGVLIDRDRIQRVFSNLLSNAVRALECEGKIWFRTKDVEISGRRFIEICIGNSGPQIPGERISEIFDAFYTSGKNGNGLGLAIVKKIVSAHDGDVWCESSEVRGTEFYFTVLSSDTSICRTVNIDLPTAICTDSSDTADEADGPDRAGSERPVKILVVDDNRFFQDAVEDLIHQGPNISLPRKVSIIRAKDAQAALEISRIQDPDVVILDIDLGPNSADGHEVLRRMRSTGVRSTICVCTSSADKRDRNRALELGADYFSTKPMPANLLSQMIASASGTA